MRYTDRKQRARGGRIRRTATNAWTEESRQPPGTDGAVQDQAPHPAKPSQRTAVTDRAVRQPAGCNQLSHNWLHLNQCFCTFDIS